MEQIRSTPPRSAEKVPLCVDLDGTLIRVDLLWESLIALLRKRPASILQLPGWLLRGKAFFKSRIAAEVDLDCSVLPYREAVLEYIRAARNQGRTIVLVTAANERLAREVADHLKLFDEVIASDAAHNLSGDKKRDVLIERFGEHGYDYAGDAAADLPVFRAAREAIFVGSKAGVLRQARSAGNVGLVLEDAPASPKEYLKLMRVHQWSKNLLIFLPLLASHKVGNPDYFPQAILAFFLFGLVASSIYILNDLFDLTSDRHHAEKRFRPLADGRVTIPSALLISAALLTIGAGVAALTLPLKFLEWLGVYVLMTTAYTLGLKRRIIVDVIVLAGLYCVRLLAGGAATDIALSHWLLAFSMFMFISLAFVKRYTEAAAVSPDDADFIRGRGYRRSDADIIRVIGPCSGLMSVLIIALYINSPDTTRLYHDPKYLWLLCPVVTYWVTRIWFLAHRNELHHDPLVFALRDWRSYTLALACLIILAMATILQ